MRELRATTAGPADLLVELRAALSGTGPALLPVAPDAPMPEAAPVEVPRGVAVVIETSGSAGTPKRVALSADALLASAGMTQAYLGGPCRWVLALPVHYVAGLQVLVRSIASESEPIVLDPGFAAAQMIDAVASTGRDPVALSVVPAQLARLVEAAEVDPAGAAVLARPVGILVGGQRAPRSLMDRARELGMRAVSTYGSSETAGGCVYDGVPLAGVHLRVDDGELLIQSPSLADGYLGDEDRTERTFLTDGSGRWYRTGDSARIDDEGRLTVLGRLDDVVISGGEKVSLGLVETAVRADPTLGDAVVVRAPHERWGEVPVVVAPREVDEAGLAALRARIRDELGRAAAPDRVIHLPSIPLLASGKPDRRALEALAARPIVRVSAVLLRRSSDGRALLVRKRGSALFMQPGGKPEPGETAAEAAVREVGEEVGVVLGLDRLRPLGTHRAAAANEGGHDVVADAFEADTDVGAVEVAAEIEEAVWVDEAQARLLPLAPLTEAVFVPLIGARQR